MISYFKKIHGVTKKFSEVVGGYPKTFLFLLKRKLFGHSITSASYKGMKFFFRYQDMSAIDETLMRGEYDFIVDDIQRADKPVIVDIGMNVGDFAVMALACNPQSRIVGIEAHPETARIAEKNASLNTGKSWTVLNRAAWKDNGMIYLETGAASVSTKISSSGKLGVQGIDMPSLFALLPDRQVDIMKIDIEGAEEEFLCAYPDYLSKIKHLIVEIHPLACNEARIRDVLGAAFSKVEDISGRISSKPLLHCWNV
jgi:FkbM family methyltransferase